MGSRPLDVARDVGVTPKDIGTIRTSKRQEALTGIAQLGVTILAAIAGFFAGKAFSPRTEDNSGYPFALLWSAPLLLTAVPKGRWIVTFIVAVVAFLTLFLLTWGSSDGTFGTATRYGVHCRR